MATPAATGIVRDTDTVTCHRVAASLRALRAVTFITTRTLITLRLRGVLVAASSIVYNVAIVSNYGGHL